MTAATDQKVTLLGFDAEESSVVSGVSYDTRLFRLWVETKEGNIYTYDGVPMNTYERFWQAESKGRFWNYYVRGRFSGSPAALRPLPALHAVEGDTASAEDNTAGSARSEFVVTYRVEGEVSVNVSAENWNDAAAQAAKVFDDPGLSKAVVSIKKA
jgi:hypothetical protein